MAVLKRKEPSMLLNVQVMDCSGTKMGQRSVNGSGVLDPTAAFEKDAREVLTEVRSAFGTLLEAIPGSVRRAAELQRRLGLDSALAWQVHRASTVIDALAVGRHLPGQAALNRVLDATRSVGVPEAAVEGAARAYSRFLELVEHHAGDRRSFDSMLASLTESGREQTDLKQRRAAFRANSHIWGLQARVLVATTIFYPGDHSVDVLQITGAVDLRPLRPDVSIRYSGLLRVMQDTSESKSEVVMNAFDGQDPGLIEAFCTRPLPELGFRRVATGHVEMTITPRGLGRSGTVTFFRRLLAHSPIQNEPEQRYASNNLVTVPAELQLVDVLVPQDWVDRAGARSSSFGARHDPKLYTQQLPEDELAPPAPVEYLGRGLECLRTPDVARYPTLIEHVMDGLGWNAERLDAFRILVRYPVLHASTVLTVPASAPTTG